MGLDLVVEGCPKPGHEREWRELLRRSFADEKVSEAEIARFREISIPGYERLGAPRVGQDPAANEWILKARGAKTPEEVADVLREFDGYYAVQLVECDGVPRFTHGGLYEGADETSFRGTFLTGCEDVLPKILLADAWNNKMPEEAIAYGKLLLVMADEAEAGRGPKRSRSLLARLGLREEPGRQPLAEQLDIVRTAGRWFVFWGERGHAIRAWF